ncbi:hypothetical protein DFQ09_105233 [Winogradskyella pacifica]|uniref:Addiction module component n=1 Tax=Winogradskyella pacifica TaxID=664642 RepID=A0A3D9MAX0_9FLAO|nr:hypothetical protein [Winogradskyella pacifica]REE17019.1 hypothetical protein DFQ09_105233 [Winogradskyella pacifica]
MDLEARKYKFIQQLSEVNETLLDKLEYVLKNGLQNSERITLDDYNKEIDEAIEDIEKGEFYTQNEANKIADQW